MTWTLRLYDDSGTEIACVQVLSDGAYTYEIVHPESSWRNIEVLLQGSQTVYADIDEPPDVTYDEVTIKREPARVEGTLTPKEHLEHVRDELRLSPDVDSTALNDE